MKARAHWSSNADVALHAVTVLWGVFLLNAVIPGVDFRQFGIQPRHPDGVIGILLCPLLHLNLAHLAANSMALFCLLTLALTFSRELTATAVLTVVLLGGGLVWVWGTGGTVVIGASGLVFGLIGFLLAAGAFRREWRALAYALVVLFLYGGTVLTLLGHTPGISWLGHATGLLSGVIAAWWTRRRRR